MTLHIEKHTLSKWTRHPTDIDLYFPLTDSVLFSRYVLLSEKRHYRFTVNANHTRRGRQMAGNGSHDYLLAERLSSRDFYVPKTIL